MRPAHFIAIFTLIGIFTIYTVYPKGGVYTQNSELDEVIDIEQKSNKHLNGGSPAHVEPITAAPRPPPPPPPPQVAEPPPTSVNLDINSAVCPNPVRLGNAGEGGWTACDTFAGDNAPCVVYSYGIRDDYSFDADVEKRGCEVHGFDPSVSLESSYNTPKRTFHLTGIGPTGSYGPGRVPFRWPGMGFLKDTNTKTWELATVSDMRKQLKHNKLKILKIDVEGGEWSAIEDMVATGLLGNGLVEQLLLELHFDPDRFTVTGTASGVTIQRKGDQDVDLLVTLQRLLGSGMKLWRWQWNTSNHCCIEVSFRYVK